jgi:NADPH2:quinone reductase
MEKTMVNAIRIHATGGPEVMQLEQVELSAPEPGFVTVRNEAIGLNYIDTYHRSGLYPLPLPTGIGLEAAGVVTAVGEGRGFWRLCRSTQFACQQIG